MQDKSKKRKIIGNVIWVVVILLLLFTPVGTSFKVWVSRLIAMSPTLEHKEDYQSLQYGQWKIYDQNGQEFNLEQLQNKVVIINFWATWCPPCIAEKPSFQALYDDYKDKVVFLFLTDEDPEVVAKFQSKHNYDLPVYYTANAAPPAVLYSQTLPASFVIDKNSNVVVKKFRAADWNSAKFRVALDSLIHQ